MFRFIPVILAVLFMLPTESSARDASSYIDLNLVDLTQFSVHYNAFDLSDDSTFVDYLKITDCDIYKANTSNPFKLQEIKQILLKKIAGEKQKDKPLYFRLPVTLVVSGYNFDTQSFSLVQDSKWKKVNAFELLDSRDGGCDSVPRSPITKVAGTYAVQLNFPISLNRIPVEKNLAESITNRLDLAGRNDSSHKLYGYVLLSIDAVQPEVTRRASYTRAVVRGQVDAIDLYVDANRKILFKRLDYAENF